MYYNLNTTLIKRGEWIVWVVVMKKIKTRYEEERQPLLIVIHQIVVIHQIIIIEG